jgi:hypothetical protein
VARHALKLNVKLNNNFFLLSFYLFLGLSMSVFRTKNLDQLVRDAEGTHLKRSLGAMDLISLGIGAIIGTGIFAVIGTAVAGDAARPGLRLQRFMLRRICLARAGFRQRVHVFLRDAR